MLTLTKNLLPTNHYLFFLYKYHPLPSIFLWTMFVQCSALWSVGSLCSLILQKCRRCGKGCQLLKLLADMSMLGLLIVDLTDHWFTVFRYKILCNKVTGFTSHLTKDHSTGFWRKDDLFFSCPCFSLMPCRYQYTGAVFDFSYSKSTVFIDSDDLLPTSRPLPVRWRVNRIWCHVNNEFTPPSATAFVPVYHSLDWSSILVSPSSLFSSSFFSSRWRRKLDWFLIYTTPTQFRVSYLWPSQELVRSPVHKVMCKHGYPFGTSSRRVRVGEI